MSSDTTAESGLRLRGVELGYGDTTVVRDVDLDVAAGEVMALLGPSGCGKSTLLRAIAGLEPLRGGSITWRGRDLAAVPVHRRRVGLMFQDHALFPHRNVGDNVAFGLRMRKVARAEQLRRVEELLTLVGLGGLGDRDIATLSGGQAQRVALARALAPEPEVLLLDEPLGSLDRALRDRLVGEIRDVVTRLGLTVVHVTHDQDEAVSVADRLALMADGAVTRVGAIDELLAEPGDAATARFLGLDTVWTAEQTASGTIDTPFGTASVQAGATGPVDVLLRADQITLTEDDRTGLTPGRPPLATVVSGRYRGGEWLVTCALPDAFEFVAGHPRRLPEGTQVRATADLNALELLSSPSGRRS